MKVKTAVAQVWAPIQIGTPSRGDYMLVQTLLKKYQQKFGNRHFNQFIRTVIKNGLWETGV